MGETRMVLLVFLGNITGLCQTRDDVRGKLARVFSPRKCGGIGCNVKLNEDIKMNT